MKDRQELTSITKDSFIHGAGKIACQFLGYLFLVVRAKVLDPFWLGIYALGITVVTMVSTFAGMGFRLSLVHFVAIYTSSNTHDRLKGLLSSALWISLMTSIFLAVVLFFSARTLSVGIFKNAELLGPLRLLSIAIPFVTLLPLFTGIFQGLKDMKSIAVISSVQPAVALLCFIPLAIFLRAKIVAAVWAFILSYFITAILAYSIVLKKVPVLKRPDMPSAFNQKEFIAYSLPLFMTTMAGVLFHQIDTLMLGFFTTPRDVGLYNPASSFVLLISFPLAVIGERFAPTIASHYHEGNMSGLRYLFSVTTRLIFIFSFPLFLFITLFSKDIMLIIGKPYLAASSVLIVLACGQIVNAGTGAVGQMLVMSRQQNMFFATAVGAHVLDFILNILFIPRFGIMGAAVTTAISLALLNLRLLFFAFKIMRFQPFTFQFYKPLMSGMAASGLVVLLGLFTAGIDYRLRLIVSGFLFFSSYFLVGLLLKYEEEEIVALGVLTKKITSFSHKCKRMFVNPNNRH